MGASVHDLCGFLDPTTLIQGRRLADGFGGESSLDETVGAHVAVGANDGGIACDLRGEHTGETLGVACFGVGEEYAHVGKFHTAALACLHSQRDDDFACLTGVHIGDVDHVALAC